MLNAMASLIPVVVLLLSSALAQPHTHEPVSRQQNVVIVNPKPQVREGYAGDVSTETMASSSEPGSSSVSQDNKPPDPSANGQLGRLYEYVSAVRAEEVIPRAVENVQGLKEITDGKRKTYTDMAGPMTPDIVMSLKAPVQKTRVRPAAYTLLMAFIPSFSHSVMRCCSLLCPA